jgi:hypothetical protein
LSWASHVVSQLTPKDEHCNREAAHETRHNQSSHAHAPYPPPLAHPPPALTPPKNRPHPTETGGWASEDPQRPLQCIHTSHAAVNTARHGTHSHTSALRLAPASAHVDHYPTHARSLHGTTPADRRGRRRRCVPFPVIMLPLRAIQEVGLQIVHGFGLGQNQDLTTTHVFS